MSQTSFQYEAVFCNYFRINRKIRDGRYKFERGDLITVKEKWIGESGEVQKRLRMIENFKRPFWITKKKYRTHKDKREWAGIDEVQQFSCPHHELSYHVQKALEEFNPDPKKMIRMVNRNPYVYGTDISPSVFVKELYNHRYKGYRTGPCDVCVLDIETDVLGADENKIIAISIVMGNKGICCALKEFIGKDTLNYENEFFKILDTDLSDVRGKHQYDITLKVFDSELEMIKFIFKTLHTEWKPDFITGWNVMMFDQKVIAERLEKFGEDPAYYFSDPSVPERYKTYFFKEGKKFSISDSGKKTNLRPISRWHEVQAPAHWVWIDAMCLYYQLRKVKGMETSYRLDAILTKNIGRGKFEIPEAEEHKGLSKHIYMQKYRPIHYCVYNLYDCIGVDLLDKKNNDIRNNFTSLLGISDYKDYTSNPTKAANNFHAFLYRERNKVIGSTSDTMFNEWDKLLPPLDGWIVALPTVMLEDNGLPILEENPCIKSKFYTHCGDIDIESSYPWGGIYNNLSRMTTQLEVAEVVGMTREERYRFGLNLAVGKINSVSNARLGFRLPDFHTTESIFDDTFEQFKQDT